MQRLHMLTRDPRLAVQEAVGGQQPHRHWLHYTYWLNHRHWLYHGLQYKKLGEASNDTDIAVDAGQQGARMQQNPMSKTDVRTAQGIAHMARMRAAAETASQPVQDEVCS